jgi:hypothetical protein
LNLNQHFGSLGAFHAAKTSGMIDEHQPYFRVLILAAADIHLLTALFFMKAPDTIGSRGRTWCHGSRNQ